MKRIVKEKFLKKKENSDTMIFNVIDAKNSNAIILIKYHINDMIIISSNFIKISFEFKNLKKKENATQTQKKEQKKEKNSKKNENKSFEKTKEKKTDE